MTEYIFFIGLAFFTNILSVFMQTKKVKFLFISIIECIGIIIGSKLFEILCDFEYYYCLVKNAEFNLNHILSGYAYTGGIIGGIITLMIISKIFGEKMDKLFIIFVPNLFLIYSISKIGCYLNGCCEGIIINNFRIPIQLIESVIELILYNIVWSQKNVVAFFFISYGIFRFIFEFFREDTYFYGSLTQIMSVAFIFLGMILYSRKEGMRIDTK